MAGRPGASKDLACASANPSAAPVLSSVSAKTSCRLPRGAARSPVGEELSPFTRNAGLVSIAVICCLRVSSDAVLLPSMGRAPLFPDPIREQTENIRLGCGVKLSLLHSPMWPKRRGLWSTAREGSGTLFRNPGLPHYLRDTARDPYVRRHRPPVFPAGNPS